MRSPRLSLRNRTRIFRTIGQYRMEEAEKTRTIEELSRRRAELNRGAPSISDKAFKEARESIEAGESTYEVDRGDSS
jgi:hypothetical protein